MPLIDVQFNLLSTQCCFALYNGSLTGAGNVQMYFVDNGQTVVDTQAAGTTRYYHIQQSTPGGWLRLQWDTPDNVLLLFAQCNDGLSQVVVNGGAPVNIPVGTCPFTPALTKEEPNLRVEAGS
ncbi:MAG: hypothetical protein IPM68_16510 [Flavobacteriales bacterium]|nr:hypothetical protein [Flavobacteriales bacterium]